MRATADRRSPPRRRAASAGSSRRGLRARDSGQASVELLGAVPGLIVLGLVAFQLLALGYAAVMAGAAAEAGALALAAGGDARASAREAVPGWSRVAMRVRVDDGRVRVRLRPLSPLRALGRRLEVAAEAAVDGRGAREGPTADAKGAR